MRKLSNQIPASLAAAAMLWGVGQGLAGTPGPVTTGSIIPNYDLPNYANSPLPQLTGSLTGIQLTDPGCGYTQPPTVTIDPPLDPNGLAISGGVAATATAVLAANGSITITFGSGGSGYIAPPNITITPAAGTTCNCPASAVPIMGIKSGTGMRKFVDSLPGVTLNGAPVSGFYTPDGVTGLNNLGQAMPIAVSDLNAYPGSDYYEIALVEYREQMHSDLPGPFNAVPDPTKGTLLRGYVQIYPPEKYPLGSTPPAGAVGLTYVNGPLAGQAIKVSVGGVQAPVYAYAKPHFLGPIILAAKGTPTRIKFYNLLPTTANGGDLFLPVDTTLMGAGMVQTPLATSPKEMAPQNRAAVHLHGGVTPWISDGTPHQWITPAGEATAYPVGASQQNVPDMPVPPGGAETIYYSNQQSGRLMFYHDHALGITRLNVYAGEAAGYLITDNEERALNATAGVQAEIPLVIQDRTFVWGDKAQAATPTGVATDGTYAVDPLWNTHFPNSQLGDLWLPHVYMANQNPADVMGGANPLGRWDYGPWFWPPQIPANLQPMPELSTVPESFMDTPVINGTAYPYINVPAGKVRLRILNAANDRMFNLQLYVADPNGNMNNGYPTEVKMIPAIKDPAIPFPPLWLSQVPGMIPEILDGRPGGVPDPTLRGPAIVQIGTEGGLLPFPVVLPNTPVGYEQNKRNIVVLNVSQRTLFMGPAERADVIIDFSNFAGKTVILYNDSPAPVPAGDPRLDYYTGHPDFSSTAGPDNQGGAPSTLPGYGPNTRTMMQFRVGPGPSSTAPVDDYNPAGLVTLSNAVVSAFLARHEIPVVPEPTYPAGTPGYSATATYSFIQDVALNFTANGGLTVNGAPISGPVQVPMLPKAIHELFDGTGRMNSVLGVELPFTSFLIQTTIPYEYIDPATETIPEGTTQIWKLTHNGVDTHAIHFHLVNVQVINRVGWDGAIRPPDPNELGWKETVRMNPLEDCIVAVQPVTPKLPFGVPNSVRPLDVTSPVGTTGQFTGVNPQDGTPLTVYNTMTDFGWEYVWHCHLLGHEENDMMRPIVYNVTSTVPGSPDTVTATASLGAAPTYTPQVVVTWTDGTPPPNNLGLPQNEIGFKIERATGPGNTANGFALLTTAPANTTSFTDTAVLPNMRYRYRVTAFNQAGGTMSTPNSGIAVTTPASSVPTAPSGLTATIQSATQVGLSWTASVGTVSLYQIWRSVNGGAAAQLSTTTSTTFTDGSVASGNTYAYYVIAVNNAGPSSSLPSNTATAVVIAPGIPTAFTIGTVARVGNTSSDSVALSWTPANTGGSVTTYRIQRSGSATFTTIQSTTTVSGTTTSTTLTVPRGTAGTTKYYFRIRAENPVGNSNYVPASNNPMTTQ